ncbi:MAG TPA: cytochrome c [Acidobacteriaceae bacterium]|jgi:mono/diheme cytochrome c family protein|nr:cytochrome c [Acidobacteriaceae bacterium]
MAAGAQAEVKANVKVNQEWFQKVPAKERKRANPYAGKAAAIAGGKRLFEEHCASCHGTDLEGTPGKPSLRTPAVEGATDGELFWLLKNGNLRYGMPTWSSLPEPERWEIVAFVKTSGSGGTGAGSP